MNNRFFNLQSTTSLWPRQFRASRPCGPTKPGLPTEGCLGPEKSEQVAGRMRWLRNARDPACGLSFRDAGVTEANPLSDRTFGNRSHRPPVAAVVGRGSSPAVPLGVCTLGSWKKGKRRGRILPRNRPPAGSPPRGMGAARARGRGRAQRLYCALIAPQVFVAAGTGIVFGHPTLFAGSFAVTYSWPYAHGTSTPPGVSHEAFVK